MEVLSLSFNQDQSCFACGMSNGFRIFGSDPLKLKKQQQFDGAVGQVEMLFCCNYVAIVGSGQRPAFPLHKVVIWDTSQSRIVVEMELWSPVRAVRLRRDRIVVALDSTVHVFSFTEQPHQLNVFDSWSNTRGLVCLCPSSDNSLLAFPSPSQMGAVQLIHLAETDKVSSVIPAHNSSLAALALNVHGTRLATASEKGTLIRVYDTSTLVMLFELRRGANSAIIYSLNFSTDATRLCCSSSHGTVHIFSLDNERQSSKILRKIVKGGVSFSRFQLPQLNNSPMRSVSAFGSQPGSIIVACEDGSYYKFHFDEPGGQCTRQTYSLFLEIAD